MPKSGASTFLNHRAILGVDGYVSSHLATIEVDEKKVLPKFLFYLLCNVDAKNLTINQNYPSLKLSDIENFKIPLPPIKAQKEIVKELDSYQKVLDGARQIIDNYKPHIEIKDEWKRVELGNKKLFEIQSGGTPDSKKRECWNGNINWITLVDLPANNFITEISDSKRKITKIGLDKSSAKLLPKGTIVVSSRATIGRVGIAKNELATNQGFKNIIIKDEKIIDNKFVAFFITTLTEHLNHMASGVTFKEISKTNFEKLQIPLPDIDIQNEFVVKIEKEQKLIEPNKKIIKIFEKKIQDKLDIICGK